MTSPDTWRNDAACADYPFPDLFFPAGDGPACDPQVAAAKAMCHTCPVVMECLTDAMNEEGALHGPSRFGIRGGLGPYERASLSRSTRRKAAKEAGA